MIFFLDHTRQPFFEKILIILLFKFHYVFTVCSWNFICLNWFIIYSWCFILCCLSLFFHVPKGFPSTVHLIDQRLFTAPLELCGCSILYFLFADLRPDGTSDRAWRAARQQQVDNRTWAWNDLRGRTRTSRSGGARENSETVQKTEISQSSETGSLCSEGR